MGVQYHPNFSKWVINPILIMCGIMYLEWVPNPIENHNPKYWFQSLVFFEFNQKQKFFHRQQPTPYKVGITTVEMGDQPHC